MLLFLVEGDSEIRTLEAPIAAFLDREGITGVVIKFAKISNKKDGQTWWGGDPTSDIKIYPGNIEEEITRRIDK